MKSLIYLIAVSVLAASCSTEPHYVINGKIAGADSITFLLQKSDGEKLVTIDSAVVKKGAFKMKGGAVAYPEMAILTAKGTRMRTSFFLENAEITIAGKLDSLYAAKITGSKTQDEYQGLFDSNKALNEKYMSMSQEYNIAQQTGDTAKINALEKQAEALQNEMIGIQKDFVKNNPSSYVTPSVLRGLSYEMEGTELESYINALDTAVSNTPMVQEMKAKAVLMKAVSVGQKAPDFTLNDPEGNPVALYSKIGSKLLLVDFWAAWCGPCRRENPNVVKVYNEFKKKGFDVLGVSLDQSKDDWVKAISDDKLTWTHVSDLQYWGNAAAKLYAVNSIPANFLLDENGVIIARNLREDDLYNKVKEILGGK